MILKEKKTIEPNLNHLPAVAAATVKEGAVGPISSALGYFGYESQRTRPLALKVNPALETYFGEHDHPQIETDLSQAHDILSQIDQRLYNQGNPEHFIGAELFSQFRQIADLLTDRLNAHFELDQQHGYLSGFVFFDRSNNQFIAFFITQHQMYPIRITNNLSQIPSNLQELLNLPNVEVDTSSEVEEELAISHLLSELGIIDMPSQTPNKTVRRMNPVTNEYPLVRNFDFDHEGEIIQELRNRGVHTIGELQSVLRIFFRQGVWFEHDQALLDNDLADRIVQILVLAFPDMTEQVARMSIARAAEDRVYYNLVLYQIRENHSLVDDFMNSPVFTAHRQTFIDAHLAALGQTNRAIAEAMLAGFYLYVFEQVENPWQSDSQYYLAQDAYYHDDLTNFLFEYAQDQANPNFSYTNGRTGNIPALLAPEFVGDVSRQQVLEALIEGFSDSQLAQISNLPVGQNTIDPQERQQIINTFDQCINQARVQRLRHHTHQALLGVIGKVTNIAVDPDQRKGVFQTAIANIAGRSVKGPDGRPQILATTWLPDNHGYWLSDGQSLPELAEMNSMANPDLEQAPVRGESGLPLTEIEKRQTNQEIINRRLDRSIRYIFGIDEFALTPDDELSEYDQFQAQEARIMSEAPVILEYLSLSDQVPTQVREFMGEILSGRLGQRILQTFGSIADQDPNIISRFYPDLQQFIASVTFRYVFDFVRGVETNLILSSKSNRLSKLKAQILENWHPHDFSQITDETLQASVNQTIADGQHRLGVLNHEVREIKTLKDFQERMEIIFGWNTQDMKFLRWTEFWSVWNTLGGAWDCVCFSRKTVFNPRAFKAS